MYEEEMIIIEGFSIITIGLSAALCFSLAPSISATLAGCTLSAIALMKILRLISILIVKSTPIIIGIGSLLLGLLIFV